MQSLQNVSVELHVNENPCTQTETGIMCLNIANPYMCINPIQFSYSNGVIKNLIY